ncbi:putative organic solute transporter subunit alpha/Transmembrane protein [Helianthus annuus]|nr:putative organic solute transporter subunit alpha/Transmembrane protein [Helianthus annuus]
MAPLYYIIIALPCTLGAIALALVHIYRHLLNYTEPTYQRFIVRIIFMVPVYALTSFLSLVFNESSIYFNSFREIYEAWVIYNFLSLCLGMGRWSRCCRFKSYRTRSETQLVFDDVLLPANSIRRVFLVATLIVGGNYKNATLRFIRRCKQGCLQFVILKPILVAVTFILYAKGKIRGWKFQCKTVIPIHHNHIHNFILYGTVCVGVVFMSRVGICSSLLIRFQIHHHQECGLFDILAGCSGFPCCKIWTHKKCRRSC